MTQLLRSAADTVRGGRCHGAHVESNRFGDCLWLQRHTSTHTHTPLWNFCTHNQTVPNTFRPATLHVLFSIHKHQNPRVPHTHLLDKTAKHCKALSHKCEKPSLGPQGASDFYRTYPLSLPPYSPRQSSAYQSAASLLWSYGGIGEREQCMLGMMHAEPEAFWEAASLQAWPLK